MPNRGRYVFLTMLWFPTTLVGLGLAGCGGPTMHSIEGKVVYKDGTPMPGKGQVLFNPVDPGKNTSARGEINEDGTFRMGTLAENDGVHEGRYRIAVVPAPPRNPDRSEDAGETLGETWLT